MSADAITDILGTSSEAFHVNNHLLPRSDKHTGGVIVKFQQ